MARDPTVITRVARLASEIDVDRAALEARHAETVALVEQWHAAGALPRAELFLMAVNLHGYYTALETLLERVARIVDEEVPAGPTWHVDLLEQMKIAIPTLRPAVIDPSSLGDVHELRKFRDFFRNAYVLDLDPARTREHAERLRAVHPSVRSSLARFRAHLDDVIADVS